MPKKKNHYRQNSLLKSSGKITDPTSPEEIEENDLSLDLEKSINKTNKTGTIAYLKSHWWAVALVAFLTLGAFGAGMKYLDEQAKKTIAQRQASTLLNPSQEGFLAKINPFVPDPTPSPTPQLSKEYIYAGSRLLAVEDANANVAPPADLAIFRPSNGTWWVLNSSGQGYTAQAWGVTNDDPVEGDYDGDGKTDFAVFHPADGSWQVLKSSDGASYGYQFGISSDKPVQADYDGDGRTDLAIFRKENGNGVWYIRRSSDAGVTIQQWGLESDTPTPADFDGDGRADLAVFRSSEAKFYYLLSSQNNSSYQMIVFGNPGDKPVPGDYDGDGRADAAVWRGDYTWHILYSSNGTIEGYTFGDPNSDIYVHNDYDGDGKVDRAFWRPSEGKWYIVNSSNNTQRVEQWGMAGDIPVPAFYRR